MRILLTNDDGVHAPGLKALYESLKLVSDVYVMAPDRDRSASSKSLTINAPLRCKQLDNGFYSVDGTPTDCVHLALTGKLLPSMDMVVSGINAGANMGDDVIYSGTVAAASEGQFLGLPSLAISQEGPPFEHFETAALVAKQLVERLIRTPLGRDVVLSVNVPQLPMRDIKGLKVCRLGKRHCSTGMIEALDPRGQTIYWVGTPGARQEAGPETDFHALASGYVTLSPLQIDLTRQDKMQAVRDWSQLPSDLS